MLETLGTGARTMGLALTPQMEERFGRYLEVLIGANQVMNLTSVRDAESIQRRHFLESLALGVWLYKHQIVATGTSLLDLGSGAGFPGVPLAIGWPELEVALLEVTQKKARFLQSTLEVLALSNARVLTGRAETLAHHPRLRGSFDVVAARSVASLPVLVELALPFLRVGGSLAAVKGSHGAEEIQAAAIALRLCGGTTVARERFFGDNPMQVVLIRKGAPTPPRYPRRPGQPASEPLGHPPTH